MPVTPIDERRSNAVNLVAAANFVLGALRIVLSVLIVWYILNTLLDGPTPNADIFAVLGFLLLAILLPLVVLIGVISIFAGIALIITGFGLRRRSQVSRIVTLVLGALGGGLAVLYGIQLFNELNEGAISAGVAISLAGLVVHGGYCVFVYLVLLNPRNAAEFR